MQPPAHTPDHDHEPHEHDHNHEHKSGLLGWLSHTFGGHAHGHHEAALDPALATRRGIWALKISLAGLLVTALLQVVVVLSSGSVALLADTIHNFSDALTALPLWLAFSLSRRPRSRRYTYGYGRAEDIAGAFIVLMILLSAGVVFYESFLKLIDPQPLRNLGWVAAASIVGFLGNEAVAIFRIRVGRQIGSAALVADGLHSRVDGFTSLGVLLGAIGVWLGFPLADPLVGFLIGVMILFVVFGAARDMWYRLMDATDPSLVAEVERTAAAVPGVLEVNEAAVRWVGHRQRSTLHIVVDCSLPTHASHALAEEVRHALFHALPALLDVTVHVDPCPCPASVDAHLPTAHHLSDASSASAAAPPH